MNNDRPSDAEDDGNLPELDIFIPPLDTETRASRSPHVFASHAPADDTATRSRNKIEVDPPPVPPDLTDRQIARLFIHPRRTCGGDFDGEPGDDGVTVLIEPRTEQGQFVARSGPVSIVLLDPAQEGPEARLGRWDFDEPTVRKLVQRETLDRGFCFRIPWGDRSPQGSRLQVHVRYVDEYGDPLDASREIRVNLPGMVAQGWTPRASSDDLESVPTAQVVSYEEPQPAPQPAPQPSPASTVARVTESASHLRVVGPGDEYRFDERRPAGLRPCNRRVRRRVRG